MMNVEEIEGRIVKQLQLDIPDLEVLAFPDRPESYDVIHPVGAILVSMDRVNFIQPNDFWNQGLTIQFEVVLLIKNLRNHQGAYELLDRIRKSVTSLGFGALRLYCLTQYFAARENELWNYTSTFIIPDFQYIGE